MQTFMSVFAAWPTKPAEASTLTQPSVCFIYSMTASRDVATVKAMIAQRYGFTPPDQYVSDLIDFVEALTDGQ